MPKTNKQELVNTDARRVELAHTRFEEARRQRDAFWVEHADVLEHYEELCNLTNMALKKFDQACRETRMGAGAVSVRVSHLPVYNVDYIEELFAGEEILDELITVTKKVQPKVFEKIASEGLLTPEEVNRAVERVDQKVSVYGMPKPTVLS
jgi:hypothetical protein